MNEYKKKVILDNIDARKREIADYEINIFNYQYIYDNAEDGDFRDQIYDGIASNARELNKVKLILEALEAQLETVQ